MAASLGAASIRKPCKPPLARRSSSKDKAVMRV